MKSEKNAIYKPPQVELFFLGEGLNLMKHFSSTGGVDDWNNGNSLENDLDDAILEEDWIYGGGLGID